MKLIAEKMNDNIKDTRNGYQIRDEKIAQLEAAVEGEHQRSEDAQSKYREQISSIIADQDRINWLESQIKNEEGWICKMAKFSNGSVHLVRHLQKDTAIAPTLREAIDAARKHDNENQELAKQLEP